MNSDFEVDIYNQHGLKDGAKYSHCPCCSHTRKERNRKVKCASLDWNRGLGTCHHCGEVFQLHTWKKSKPFKEYYAFNENDDGTTTYYHHDGTETRE